MNGDSNAWLVMKGRSIRLQHQDHVKNALITPRQIQSANVLPQKRILGHCDKTDLTAAPNYSNGTRLPHSGRTSRALCRNHFSPVPHAKSYLSFTNPIKEKGSPQYRNGAPNRNNFSLAPPTASTNELNKSIVIKIPHQSRFSH